MLEAYSQHGYLGRREIRALKLTPESLLTKKRLFFYIFMLLKRTSFLFLFSHLGDKHNMDFGVYQRIYEPNKEEMLSLD